MSSWQQFYIEMNDDMLNEEEEFEEENNAISRQFEIAHQHFFSEGSSSNYRGSVVGRKDRRYMRDYKSGHERLMRDYFIDNPTYDVSLFRRRFRMSPAIFNRIYQRLNDTNPYFTYRRNCANETGISPHIKISSSLRMLSYGTSGDQQDEYFRLAGSTAIECMKEFCKSIIEEFGPEYLRTPGPNDIARLLAKGEARGFPGMLGSLDCMHWAWKNCPTGWKGMFTGHKKIPTMILEAVASDDLWVWHAFFGVPGSLNDINVLRQSYLFSQLSNGLSTDVEYKVGDSVHKMGYYLVDGIYPKWRTLIQAFRVPNTEKEIYFTRKQESFRKDIERAFGVLQARFQIIRNPARFHDKNVLSQIMYTCIILHNMIVESERGGYKCQKNNYPDMFEGENERPHKDQNTMDEYVATVAAIEDQIEHYKLRDELVNHLWTHRGRTGRA